MRRLCPGYLLTAVALAGAPVAVAAEAPNLVLQPTSPWNVDYGEDSCALRRSFGDGERTVLLEIRQFQPGIGASVTIVANGLVMALRREIEVLVEPESRPRVNERYFRISLPQNYRGYLFFTALAPQPQLADAGKAVPLTEMERDAWESSIRAVKVTSGFDPEFTLATGPLHRPLAAMRQCLDELLTHWGIDVEAHKSLSRRVESLDPMSLAQHIQAAYPSYQLDTGQDGIVRARLMIDAQGKPTSCHIQLRAKDDAFETTACRKLMAYGKFKPALDKDGTPLASYWITTVTYQTN